MPSFVSLRIRVKLVHRRFLLKNLGGGGAGVFWGPGRSVYLTGIGHTPVLLLTMWIPPYLATLQPMGSHSASVH